MKSILGIIPARYASTRLPGKPLAMIGNKTMIRRVYEQAAQSAMLETVCVATDDERIYEEVQRFGGLCMMTSPQHKNGTERCFEALFLQQEQGKNYGHIINIQGDEPFIHPGQIDELCRVMLHTEAPVGTLIKKIKTTEELLNPNIVKVVTETNGKALYFSRSPIPFVRDTEQGDWVKTTAFYRHIGLYAFQVSAVEAIRKLGTTTLETAESLEQLRWLENGLVIQTGITGFDSFAIDSPEDLEQANSMV